MYDNNYLLMALSHAGLNDGSSTFIKKHNEGSDVVISYSEFFANAERMASALVSMGVVPGDKVLIQSPKSVTGIELYIACLMAGSVYVPVNPAIDIEGMSYFIDDAEPKIVVCSSKNLTGIRELPESKNVACVLSLDSDESGSLPEARDSHIAGFESIARSAEDLAAILYTSGTTGRPKGVMHTHLSLLSNAQALTEYWAFTADDVLIHALPIFHLHGLFTAINITLCSGSSCIYLEAFDCEKILDYMPESTSLMGVPPFYMSLLKSPRLEEASKGMRLFISGSAPMLPQTHKQWSSRTGSMILERYGMTECSMIASNPYDGERRVNSVGFALPGTTTRLADPVTGLPQAGLTTGILEIKGPNVFSGYWKKPDKTAEDMREDGYFISGDYAKYDVDGYISILGRAKDVIQSCDGTIFPKEVEELIDAIPGVDESAVISAPHGDRGNAGVAVIVLEAGIKLEQAEILDLLGNSLDAYKRPLKVEFIESLPRNIMGKVQKNELRSQYKEAFS